MAESSNSGSNKTGILAKAQRRLARTKTKVLQNLGKAERTTDDIVNDYGIKVDKQQETGQHLQKEVKNYIHCVRNLCQASKSLHACLSTTYEEEWSEEPVFKDQMKVFDLLWSDYAQNMQESVTSLQTYLQSFPTLKTKVAKRGRKMVDFDNARHHLEVLNGAKKRDEIKIQKAQEDLNETKRIYEQMNNELHTELPDFYNSRVSFYASLFTSMFGTEFVFHSEIGKTYGTLGDVSQKLSKDYEQFVYQPRTPLVKSHSSSSTGEVGVNGDSSSTPSTPGVSSPRDSVPSPRDSVPSPTTSPTRVPSSRDSTEPVYNNQTALDASMAKRTSGGSQVNGDDSNIKDEESNISSEYSLQSSPAAVNHQEKKIENIEEDEDSESKEDDEDDDIDNSNVYNEPNDPPLPARRASHSSENAAAKKAVNDDDDDDEGDVYSGVPSNKPLYNAPPDAVYTVETTHKYQGEDEDELNFEAGEIIHVLDFENPDEQDDGWQLGIKQSDGKKGVFPENFTKRVLE